MANQPHSSHFMALIDQLMQALDTFLQVSSIRSPPIFNVVTIFTFFFICFRWCQARNPKSSKTNLNGQYEGNNADPLCCGTPFFLCVGLLHPFSHFIGTASFLHVALLRPFSQFLSLQWLTCLALGGRQRLVRDRIKTELFQKA